MAVPPGTRFGVYEIADLIGSGGMGEVYRATDITLGRQVAIKILPDALAADSAHLARLEREARTLATLNHPHIAAVYGFEPRPDGRRHAAIIMELVEGPTLARRIADGAIPLDEALPIAKQIADALDAAHARGIVHRDLKPANIKVRDDGTVKVLDFGLAKAIDHATTMSVVDAGASPTVTTPALTQSGMVLGTAAYMSPEQARGRPVDKRADLWAFGVVLFEMLTGKRLFDGETVSDTMAAVLTREPAWSALPPQTPAPIRRLLRRCLEKDSKRRLADAADARAEIEDALAPSGGDSLPAPSRRLSWAAIAGALAGVGLAASAIVWVAMSQGTPTPAAPVTRLTLTTTPELPLTQFGLDRDVTIAPDGSYVVYRSGAQGRLVLRYLNRLDATPLAGVTDARAPFISPDSKWIGYFGNDSSLHKVSVEGGPPIQLARLVGNARGADWHDDTILAASANPSTVWRIPANGGAPVAILTANRDAGETSIVSPRFLPGGQAALVTVNRMKGQSTVELLDLQSGQRVTLVDGASGASYVASGHLVLTINGGLSAVAFDLANRRVTGAPVRIVEGVAVSTNGAASAAVSSGGTLVYLPAAAGGLTFGRSLVWVDRQGRETPIAAPSRAYVSARISPDGARAAVDIRDQEQDVWIWSFIRGTLTRLTFDSNGEVAPVWTADGARIVYARQPVPGAYHLFARLSDGSGSEAQLAGGDRPHVPTAITPDGTALLGYQIAAATKRDLVRTTLATVRERGDPGPPEVVLGTPSDERNATVSPDGRFLAYQDDESGEFEVYIRPYPDVRAGRWQVSTQGGTRPAWTRGGRELVFLNGANEMTSVDVEVTGASVLTSPPKTLFTTAYARADVYRTYDVTRDGQRFLMIKQDPDVQQNLVVVQNWFEELNRLAPRQ